MPSEQVQVSSQSVRLKTDPAWEHCIELPSKTSGGKKRLKCLQCANEFAGGGIHRMKQHLAGVKGDAISCKKVPNDVCYRLEQNLKEIEDKKSKKQDNYEEDNPYGPSVPPFESDAPDPQEVSPSLIQNLRESQLNAQDVNTSQLRKQKATGDINNYFAPRTTPRAQPGIQSALAGFLTGKDLLIQLIMKVLVNLSIGSWKMKMILLTFVMKRYKKVYFMMIQQYQKFLSIMLKILMKKETIRLRVRLIALKLESLIWNHFPKLGATGGCAGFPPPGPRFEPWKQPLGNMSG